MHPISVYFTAIALAMVVNGLLVTKINSYDVWYSINEIEMRRALISYDGDAALHPGDAEEFLSNKHPEDTVFVINMHERGKKYKWRWKK